MPEEVIVWERYLAITDMTDKTIDYDVKVGEGIKTPADMPEPYARNSVFLSKKRIDAVVTGPENILIVEVKQLAGWTSIGQVLGYPVLFQLEFNPDLPVGSLLVAESLTLDTKTILDFYGISYLIV